MKLEDPYSLLGISAEAGDEEIRAAYLRKVKEFPPDRSPREFERVRDAYDQLRDSHRRARSLFLNADPERKLVSLLQGWAPQRKFAGPSPWLAVLREKKS